MGLEALLRQICKYWAFFTAPKFEPVLTFDKQTADWQIGFFCFNAAKQARKFIHYAKLVYLKVALS